jgi:plastocyanin
MSRSPAGAAAIALLIGALAAGASGCSPRPAPRTWRIVIHDMTFDPPPASVRVGDRIEWVNKDIFRHSATARDGRFDLDLQPGTTKVSRIDKPGSFEVYCRYHPGMKLRISSSR